ncbi:hypothetical protein NQ317_014875 [Molorchus minor]|uniref:ATP-dependent RNA helicase DHX57 n=1 Tax=Molorchus minor TaxID=1323400 RepID=A0ABQ9J4C5_9CUCU|nr:hypothetical protein NQ317_014875 [Molorchus minor]
MDSEKAINAADFFLRDIPSVKVGNSDPHFTKNIVKEELQFLRFSDTLQEQILETLKYIHGPDFRLKDASAYEEGHSNLLRKYWVGRGSLVVKGGCNFSMNKDEPEEESERLRHFGLMRLERNILTTQVNKKAADHGLSKKELMELWKDEKSSLESIYENSFKEKVENVWILTLKLEYLICIFHKKNEKQKKNVVQQKKRKNVGTSLLMVIVNLVINADFLMISKKITPNANAHLENFVFELEIRFPPNTKYPYEPPLIFLKTNAVLPPLINLHICKRLFDEAKLLAEDGIPSVYTITELLQNDTEIKSHLTTEIDFIPHNRKLFSAEKNRETKKLRASHYKKGFTNRGNKKSLTLEELEREDKIIVERFTQKIKEEKYNKMLEVRKKLTSVDGETGCGKSTQIPQYILDEWIVNYNKDRRHIEIVCTQPRRISAIGVAERVADERVEQIGKTVGYQIRLESKVSMSTRLTFCTTGILLRRLEGEPTLPNVTHIIVDEVHERSEESDFLLLILKELLYIRPDLKVILMSATLNANLFSKYFGEVPVLSIPGKTFHVEQFFLEDILEISGYVLEEGSEYARKIKNDSDYLDVLMSSSEVSYSAAMPRDNIKDENLSIAQVLARYRDYSTRTCKNVFLMDPEKINYELIETTLKWIVSGDHKFPRSGTILIFLPGIAEITTLYDQLIEHRNFGSRAGKFVLVPLHSSLTNEEQAAIFRKPKYGIRKIVLSTNLAETSVTIDDCVFVIDSGKMKEKYFDPNRNMESLETVWVTRANALQRKGRAGRVMPGVCVHLYTNCRFKHHMLPQPIPEINRIPLEKLILNIKILPNFYDREIMDVIGAFIEPPSEENVVTAIRRLEDVGALDKDDNLTPLGHHLAPLPVDVRIGKLMLYGAIFGCVDAALTMAACLSYKNPFVAPFGKREEANWKKQSFAKWIQ